MLPSIKITTAATALLYNSYRLFYYSCILIIVIVFK